MSRKLLRYLQVFQVSSPPLWIVCSSAFASFAYKLFCFTIDGASCLSPVFMFSLFVIQLVSSAYCSSITRRLVVLLLYPWSARCGGTATDFNRLSASTRYTMKRMGLRKFPCGTPMLVLKASPISFLTRTHSTHTCIQQYTESQSI